MQPFLNISPQSNSRPEPVNPPAGLELAVVFLIFEAGHVFERCWIGCRRSPLMKKCSTPTSYSNFSNPLGL